MSEIDDYISKFPENVQEILQKIRTSILKELPNATEKIGYGIPGIYLNKKPVVYFAAFKNHIGFYATPNGHEAFRDELSKYKQGKGSVQFPLKDEIPYDLMLRIAKFRAENLKS